MAIIENLSVTAGGGIISSASQCKQKDNVVSLFIGLGGTGTDAIRAIKTQVNERLIPDNHEAYDDPNSNVSVREYRHIRFLSIDTDKRSSEAGQMGFDMLDNTEKMDLSLSGNIGIILTDHRPDLKWIKDTNGSIAQVIARGDGAGGIRQAGRYLLFDKLDDLESKIQRIVDDAKVGFVDDCKVVVHIMSGVSGGTGSGTFLDVCYAVRNALSGITNKMIVGYFFMPDISLSKPGLDQASKKFIPMNGYAALQELNYCMSIPDNGGAFRQIIKDGSYIDWNCPPVEMCHLIGSQTEKLANISDDAYDYAMHTVTEYVMDFLSDNTNQEFDGYQLASNQATRIATASKDRTGGYRPCMVSLGAACASIPYREINTYLACGMFEEYRKVHNENVQQADADDAVNKAWNVTSLPLNTMVEKIYASLLQKLTGNDSTGLQGYDYYQDPDGLGKPWKFLLETVDTNGMNDLEGRYIEEMNNHFGNLAANADKLVSQGVDGVDNKESLIYLLDQALDPIVKDIRRGPKFAKNIIDHVEGANVLNLIQGLKAKNHSEYQSKEKDRSLRYEDYQETKRIFFNQEKQGMFDSDKKRYEDFENCVIAYVQLIELCGGVYSSNPNARPQIGVYGHINNILDTLEKQIKERVANYYAPLSDTLVDLTDTFEANYRDLLNKSTANKTLGFNNPLISINDDSIISLLDEEIKGIPMPDTFRKFMEFLTAAGYDVWQKKETRLPKTVQSFFVGRPGGVFADFAGMTVDNFLEKKYGLTGQNLEQQIIKDFVGDLRSASVPLLALDSSKLNSQKNYQRKVTFPSTSSVISHALGSTNSGIDQEWTQIPSSISDRLLFVQIRDGFPLQAYTGCSDLENDYFRSAVSDATHLYEENGIYPDIKFSDWRALPTITAPSVVDPNAPDAIKSKIETAKELFDKAVALGIIKINEPYDESKESDYSYIYSIDENIQAEIDGLSDALNAILQGDGSISSKAAKLSDMKARVNELLGGAYKELVRTNDKLKQTGGRHDDPKYDMMMKKDFLYMSPVYQIKIRNTIEKMDGNLNTLQGVVDQIKQKDEEFSKLEANYKKNFYLALYTGILSLKDDGSIVYEHDDNGLMRPYVLSAYGENMKYEDVPYYQAYVTYLGLDESLQDTIYKLASKNRASDAAKQYARDIKERKFGDTDIANLRTQARNLYDSDTADKVERFLVDLKNFIF